MNELINHTSERNKQMDELEALMINSDNQIDCPLKHTFTPGLYTRQIFMPAGSLITSQVHRTEHQFMVLKGCLTVFTDNAEQFMEAGHIGITYSGTRRALVIHEDTVWVTCHATDIKPEDDSEEAIEKAVALIEEQIIEPHVNSILGGELKQNVLVKEIESNNNLKL